MAPTNGDDIVNKDDIKRPGLRVLIAGAGIGGLTAAIALRNQGHVVHVFEKFSVLRASPYAIHLAPNGVGLLRKLGVDIEGMGAVTMDSIRFFREDGHMFSSEDRKATAYRWQHQWFLGPRENLNQQLVHLATSGEGLGQPVTIHTDSKVISVDADTSSLTLSGGQVFQGDVVIGADGVHSNTREAIQRLTPYRSRHNCFRMLLDRKELSGLPNTHIPKDNTMDMIYSEHTKMVVYPTLRNTKYNCVVTHPTEFTLHFTGDPKAKMMELCAHHHESFRNMLSTAEDAKFRIWPLYDMDPPTSFIKNRFAILGDAAHPFTPHLAQGAMMAIEDATSLGIMLHRGVGSDEIPERLQLYNQARHERSLHIQKLSLIVGGDRVADEDGEQKGQPLNVQKSLDMALSHDENHASARILHEWLWSKDPQHWLSPTTFGPAFPLGTNSVSAIHTAVLFTAGEFTASISYRTSATLLRNLLPRQVSFVATDSTAEMTIQLQTCAPTTPTSANLRYSLRFYVHGITYAAAESTDSAMPACCCILSIESCPDFLTYSRDILGLPSRYSDIQCGLDDGSLSISVISEGICWGKLVLPDLCATEEDKYSASRETSSNIGESLLVHKFIPATGRVRRHSTPSEKEENRLPDADYLIMYPPKALWPQNGTSGAVKTRCSGLNARLEIPPETEDRLPALSSIISRLRELPLLEVLDAVVSTDCDRRTWDWNGGYVVSSVRKDSA